jgi:hypothetical protein
MSDKRERDRLRTAALEAVTEVTGQAPDNLDGATAEKLAEAALAADALYDLSDAQIAALLGERVWPRLSVLELESDLATQAIDRLQRAGGGPYPREEQP